MYNQCNLLTDHQYIMYCRHRFYPYLHDPEPLQLTVVESFHHLLDNCSDPGYCNGWCFELYLKVLDHLQLVYCVSGDGGGCNEGIYLHCYIFPFHCWTEQQYVCL